MFTLQVSSSAVVVQHCYRRCTGGEVPLPLQVVPEGIVSVNGSSTTMGCERRIDTFSGVMYCGVFAERGSSSFLVDGISPAIDSSVPDWASELVTVRKTDPVPGVSSGYVVFTFDFSTAISLVSIELDLLQCPEWNIGSSFIGVFADNNTDLILGPTSTPITNFTMPLISSCDSLITANITFKESVWTFSYFTWHLLMVYSTQSDLEWAYVGDIRFLTELTPTPTLSETFRHTPSEWFSYPIMITNWIKYDSSYHKNNYHCILYRYSY